MYNHVTQGARYAHKYWKLTVRVGLAPSMMLASIWGRLPSLAYMRVSVSLKNLQKRTYFPQYWMPMTIETKLSLVS